MIFRMLLLARIWVKKPGEENNMKGDVEMSMVLGFATDWFRSNVRVILQYSVNLFIEKNSRIQ